MRPGILASVAIIAAVALRGQPALGAQDTTTSRVRSLGVVAPRPEASRAAAVVGAAGFHDRCSERHLACVTEEQLETRKTERLSDFLARTGAVKRRCAESVSQCVVSMSPSSGVGECTPSYFVDGVAFRVSPDVVLSELERLLPPSEILGIEIYRSEQRTPPALSPSSGCGVIAIWRR